MSDRWVQNCHEHERKFNYRVELLVVDELSLESYLTLNLNNAERPGCSRNTHSEYEKEEEQHRHTFSYT